MPPSLRTSCSSRDFTRDEFEHLFERTRWIKERFKRYELYQPLRDRTLAMVFEKASTRTRVSFEAGMNQLGGIAINLNARRHAARRAASRSRTSRASISRMVDVVMIRTFEQIDHRALRRALARAGDQRPDQRIPPVPDPRRRLHVRRASRLDRRAGRSRGSAMRTTCAAPGCRRRTIFDFTVHVSTPPGYDVDPARRASTDDRTCRCFDDPLDACRSADLVTTDVWTSMGFEAENEAAQARLRRLAWSTPT